MPNIKPISELGAQFQAFAEELKIGSKPIFLTKNGKVIMVAMNADTYWYDYLLIREVREAEEKPNRRYAKTGTKADRNAAKARRRDDKLKGVTYVHVYEEPGQVQRQEQREQVVRQGQWLRELAEHVGIEIVGQYTDIDDGSNEGTGLSGALSRVSHYEADVIVVSDLWQLAHGKEGYAQVSRQLWNTHARVYTLLDLVAREKGFAAKIQALITASKAEKPEENEPEPDRSD